MNKKRLITSGIQIISIFIIGIAIYIIYLYIYVLRDASRYPSGVMEDMIVYSINPETTLASIDFGKVNIFMPALKNPVYDDVEVLWSPGTFDWDQKDYLKVADTLHRVTWNEHLKKWNLYSANFDIFQCKDITRIDQVSFGFYQRQGNWYYLIHNMKIDLGYGLAYAGNDDGYYTGNWKDIDLDKAKVNTTDKALLIAEQYGGKQTRDALIDSDDCHINIFFAPFIFDQDNWGWRVTYKRGESFVYGIMVDPYTGKYEILNSGQ